MKKNYYRQSGLLLFLSFLLTLSTGYSQTQITVIPSGGTAGNTNGNGADPISDYFESIRYQVVYTAAELTAAGLQPGGTITALAWDVTEAPGVLDNYTVRMGHTSATNSAAHNASATTVVKNAFAYTPTVGLTDITFDVSFVWDGSQNILVEICTGPANPYSSPYGGVTAKTGITDGCRYVQDDGAGSQCGVVTNNTASVKPYVRFTFTPPPPCAGTPTAGTASASVGSACANTPFAVSTTGATIASAITYQWQSSPQGMNTFTNIAGATGASYTVANQTAATDYFCIVTCTNGGSSDSTNIVSVGQNAPNLCYCTPTAGSSSTTYYLNNITSTGAISNLAYTAGAYSPYSNAYATASTIVLPGSNLNVTLGITGGSTYYFHCWVDWNNDGDFADAGEAVFATTGYVGSPYSNVIPVSAGQAPGDYRVRMAASFIGAVTSPCGPNAYGNFVDFKLNVALPAPCTGTPTTVAVTPAGPVSACLGSIVNLSSSVTPVLSNGFNYQWYMDGSPIVGATSASYSFVPSVATANYFLVAKCPASPSDSTISNVVTVDVTAACPTPCVPTGGASSTAYYLNNITTTGALSNFAYTSSSYAAYQDSYSTTSCTQLPGSSVNVYMASSAGTNYYYCWIDWNLDGDFADAGETIWSTTSYTTDYNGIINIPASQMPGDYRMRFGQSFIGAIAACGPSAYGSYVDTKLKVMQQTDCAIPTAFNGTSLADSMLLSWNWAQSVHPIQSFDIQYGILNSGITELIPANGINTNDTIINANFVASGVYEVYLQAICATDSSDFIGPITIVMPITNDLVCASEPLQLNSTYTLNNVGASVSLNESNIAPPATSAQTTTGWVNSTLNGTLWYSFVAPSSGSVRVNSTGINYNGQAAVYSSTNCADFNTFLLKAANDDAIGGTSLAPNFTICDLTPGSTYYIMYDKFNSTSGNFSLRVTEIVLDGGIALPLTKICYGEMLDLFTTINNNSAGGTWSSPISAVNASITDSMFNSNGLAYTTFNLEYRVVDGCAYDSIVSQVKIYAFSNAGMDGTITACRNEPIDLLAGLNGNADLNGDWYDPSNNGIPNSQITTANFPGQYNYDYISGNGVCPDDTANVVVTVLSCNFLSVAENALEEVSLYPNPSTGVLFIESTFTAGNFDLVVTDVNGRTIQVGKNAISAGTNTINLKEVERGTYFFKLSSDDAEKIFRVVIQ